MKQKIAIVTGASRGLGLELSRVLQGSGYRVLGLARSHPESDGFFGELRRCDLASPASVDDAIKYIEDRHSHIDLLVHNAAIQTHFDILEETHYPEILAREHQVNFLTPVKMTASLLPLLLKEGGRIVIVTSLLQYGSKKCAPGYSSSKAALASWTNNLRAQLKNTSVSVTEVVPGLIKTSMTENAAKKGIEPGVLAGQVLENLERDRIVLPGAKLPALFQRCFPTLFQKVTLKD